MEDGGSESCIDKTLSEWAKAFFEHILQVISLSGKVSFCSVALKATPLWHKNCWWQLRMPAIIVHLHTGVCYLSDAQANETFPQLQKLIKCKVV